ncbi:MAG: HTH-type transcriptional repressor FabR [Nevskia sp.]|nr:HTH-type transcriptional repressor FabR [Nevskia sp.]
MSSKEEPAGAVAERQNLGSRSQRKQLTRDALLEAALRLMKEGRGFTGLSLREVTREAGVVPTAFYRHFRDMDELGLALVEECGMTLRRLLRETRRAGVPLFTDMIRRSVLVYKRYVEDNRLQFLFISSERDGGSPVIREAIRREVAHFTNEMAQDLRSLNAFPGLSMATLEMICGLVVNGMLSTAADILDLPPRRPELDQELVEDSVRRLRVIFLGALQWREKPAAAKQPLP